MFQLAVSSPPAVQRVKVGPDAAAAAALAERVLAAVGAVVPPLVPGHHAGAELGPPGATGECFTTYPTKPLNGYSFKISCPTAILNGTQ